jgi:hypothetical protein
MLPPQFFRGMANFNGVLEHGVVAVPLNEVGPAHERPVLGRAAVVVPEVEVEEIDRMLKDGFTAGEGNASGIRQFSSITAVGTDQVVPPSTKSAYGGLASCEFDGGMAPDGSGTLTGNYELMLAGLNSEPSIWPPGIATRSR